MENIRQAVERAKALHAGEPKPLGRIDPVRPRSQPLLGVGRSPTGEPRVREVELNRAHLESRRIIAHDKADLRSRSFDMLRTQVLQSMDLKDWKFLGITSPTAACGKTLSAVNLALSIARQPERSVLLVDLDLQKPQVAKSLGINCDEGVLSLLGGQSILADAVVQVRVGDLEFMVLPTEASTSGSSEWMASRAMSQMLQDIRKSFPGWIVIIDLPPVLSSDDVIAMLPLIDCAVMVAAVGTSTVSEIKQCNRHLQSTEVLRLVLNKVPESSAPYYY